MPGSRVKTNLRWIVCGLLFLATTINYMDRSALGLVEPILKHMLGGDRDVALYNKHYSDIVICFIAAYGIGFLIAGRLIDRIGAKKGYAISIVVWGLASISHAFARTTLGFGMARFALGLGEAGNFPAALKATADWFPPEERALATGIFNSGTSAASLIAPLLIPWVALRYGWQSAFLTTGGLSLIWLAAWLLFPYRRLLRQSLASANSSPASEEGPPATFRSLLGNRGTWAFALSKAATDPIWWLYLFWLPKFFHERFQVDMAQIGLPLIIVYAGSTVGSIAGGWLAGYFIRRGRSVRYGRRLAMLICALCATPVILVPFVHPLWQAIGLLCLATAAHQGWSSNLLSTPSDMFPASSVGTVVGIGGAVGSVGSTLFTTFVGMVWTNHALLIFLAAGSAYPLTLFAFQWRNPVRVSQDRAIAATI
jgi:ACS family hexuronate transporter-like MFS transporter